MDPSTWTATAKQVRAWSADHDALHDEIDGATDDGARDEAYDLLDKNIEWAVEIFRELATSLPADPAFHLLQQLSDLLDHIAYRLTSNNELVCDRCDQAVLDAEDGITLGYLIRHALHHDAICALAEQDE
jgi:hypothetical protein